MVGVMVCSHVGYVCHSFVLQLSGPVGRAVQVQHRSGRAYNGTYKKVRATFAGVYAATRSTHDGLLLPWVSARCVICITSLKKETAAMAARSDAVRPRRPRAAGPRPLTERQFAEVRRAVLKLSGSGARSVKLHGLVVYGFIWTRS